MDVEAQAGAREVDPETIRAQILRQACICTSPREETLATLRRTALRLLRERRFVEAASVLDQVLVLDPDDAPAGILRAFLDMAS